MSESNYVPPTGGGESYSPKPPEPAKAKTQYRSYAEELAARKAAAATKGVNPELDALDEKYSPESTSESSKSGTGLGLFFGCGGGCLTLFLGVFITFQTLSAAPLFLSAFAAIFVMAILFGVGKKLGSK